MARTQFLLAFLWRNRNEEIDIYRLNCFSNNEIRIAKLE